MDDSAFATFKYRHADSGMISRQRKIIAVILLLLGLPGLLAFVPFGLICLFGALVAFVVRDKKLLLGPRYLLCGNQLLYYANVCRVSLSSDAGSLLIETVNGRRFTLERDKFPTNARKAPKIAANKAAKFAKVSGKIIDKVRAAAPAAEILGT